MHTENTEFNRLLVTGDLHGDTAALTMIAKKLLQGDVLFVAGDFGFIFRDNQDERSFLNDVDMFLRKLGTFLVFVDGNHENHKALNEFPVDSWQGAWVHLIRSHVIHVLRGEVLTLKGKNIFCFGGAFSIDRSWRVLGESYWEEEIPTDEDYCNGNTNLEKCGYKIDYVLTHTCPIDLVLRLGSYHSSMEEQPLQNYLQYVSDQVYGSLQKWFFGHWHKDRVIGLDGKFRAIYLDVVNMETGEIIE